MRVGLAAGGWLRTLPGMMHKALVLVKGEQRDMAVSRSGIGERSTSAATSRTPILLSPACIREIHVEHNPDLFCFVGF